MRPPISWGREWWSPHLEGCGDHRLLQGEVEDVREHLDADVPCTKSCLNDIHSTLLNISCCFFNFLLSSISYAHRTGRRDLDPKTGSEEKICRSTKWNAFFCCFAALFFPCLNSLVEGLLNYTLYVECLICFSISVHFKKLSFTISKFNG